MHKPLTDQVTVVTGGSGLIGAQFARAISDAGGVAIIADIDVSRGEQLCNALVAEASERKVAFVEMDITSSQSIDAAIDLVIRQHGRIDALVNNAYPRNRQYGRRLEEVTYDDFVANMGMHVGGYFLASQRFLRLFRGMGRGGCIVNMGSVYGLVAPRFSVYSATEMTMPIEYAAIKAAVIHITRYFAQYTKGEGIRVNCISPGGVLDQQPPSFLQAYREYASDKGMLSPDDLDGTLLFLLSSASRYVNGQNIVVDDGWSL